MRVCAVSAKAIRPLEPPQQSPPTEKPKSPNPRTGTSSYIISPRYFGSISRHVFQLW
jgi:hypothetical protein